MASPIIACVEAIKTLLKNTTFTQAGKPSILIPYNVTGDMNGQPPTTMGWPCFVVSYLEEAPKPTGTNKEVTSYPKFYVYYYQDSVNPEITILGDNYQQGIIEIADQLKKLFMFKTIGGVYLEVSKVNLGMNPLVKDLERFGVGVVIELQGEYVETY